MCGSKFARPENLRIGAWRKRNSCNRKCGTAYRIWKAGKTAKVLFYERTLLPEKEGDCWIWRGETIRGGYGRLKIKGERHIAHRLSYEIFHGKIPDQLIVRHDCDNPKCVNPNHLIIGTHKDNTGDIWARNRGNPPKGEVNGQSKLTEEDIIVIRERRESIAKTARRYGVSVGCIANIRSRKTWKHI